ncbi:MULTISPECIES: hypothetical protein [unclassified Streptomyces]|uniref:hypothetical protein n=1 Tax=unclassified Streptomyces TaxID=2593676 RepID=UPI002E2AC37D|nr:hypothetical protein [Streptomyces sp. NBC_01423]WSX95427.1 hypothetical protein OH827_22760 [Streptomyces sp. NBC_00891]WSY09908.1 hypothetical protein OG464_22760 [Streptomyces sp. NBC_00890]WSZ11528.1 hypothetical protein OG704_22765 [Streptomyces sp. NBC_00869]WSZ27486.1 hypothetical protein OG498_10805 [Streptomyces sp. NBC_00870]
MKRIGTIDRPLTHDPRNQAPMTIPTAEPAGSATPDVTIIGANDSRQNRTREMQLIPEALARAHMHDRLHEAEAERQAVRLVSARRMQRRAERASMRARRALAMAVMH